AWTVVTPLVGLDADDLALLGDDAFHLDAQPDVGPFTARRLGVRCDDLYRLDVAGFGLVDGDFIFLEVGIRIDVGEDLGGDGAHVDAEFLLHLDVGVEAGLVLFVDDEDHAGAGEDAWTADDGVELLVDAQAPLGHARGETVGVMLADNSAGFAARAGPE